MKQSSTVRTYTFAVQLSRTGHQWLDRHLAMHCRLLNAAVDIDHYAGPRGLRLLQRLCLENETWIGVAPEEDRSVLAIVRIASIARIPAKIFSAPGVFHPIQEVRHALNCPSILKSSAAVGVASRRGEQHPSRKELCYGSE